MWNLVPINLKLHLPDESTESLARWHHQVNYKPFKKNRLIKKEGVSVVAGTNNYGMVLKEV